LWIDDLYNKLQGHYHDFLRGYAYEMLYDEKPQTFLIRPSSTPPLYSEDAMVEGKKELKYIPISTSLVVSTYPNNEVKSCLFYYNLKTGHYTATQTGLPAKNENELH
jgi:hypothetical protein